MNPQHSHINLDQEAEAVKRFFRSVAPNPEGSVLDLDGQPIVRLIPMTPDADQDKLRRAILNRRDTSRQLNDDWKAVDREISG